MVGENKGTSKVVLQLAAAISSVASFINRYSPFTSSPTLGFADMDGLRAVGMYAPSLSQPMKVVNSPPTFRPELSHPNHCGGKA